MCRLSGCHATLAGVACWGTASGVGRGPDESSAVMASRQNQIQLFIRHPSRQYYSDITDICQAIFWEDMGGG